MATKKKTTKSNESTGAETRASSSAGTATSSEKPAAKAAPKAAKAAAAAKGYAVIDHPMEGEIISSRHYAVRIGASEAERVEISIDGHDWSPCRSSAGYWWYDWSGYNSGGHQIEARLVIGNSTLKSETRRVTPIF